MGEAIFHVHKMGIRGGGENYSATLSGTGWGKWLGINRNKKGFRLTRSSIFGMWGFMWGLRLKLEFYSMISRVSGGLGRAAANPFISSG